MRKILFKARLSSCRHQHNGIIQQERERGVDLRVQQAHVGIYNQAARWGQWKEIPGIRERQGVLIRSSPTEISLEIKYRGWKTPRKGYFL